MQQVVLDLTNVKGKDAVIKSKDLKDSCRKCKARDKKKVKMRETKLRD